MVAPPADYRHSLFRRHLGVLRAALKARGPFDGVEGHVLYSTFHRHSTGLFVAPGDPAGLAAAIERLSDHAFRARLGRAGPASVAAHSKRSVAEAMARVWGELGVRL